jgi:hypothetical protein
VREEDFERTIENFTGCMNILTNMAADNKGARKDILKNGVL